MARVRVLVARVRVGVVRVRLRIIELSDYRYTTEPIKMLFGMWARVGPHNNVLIGWGFRSPWGRSSFEVSVYGHAHGRYLSRCHLACGLEWTQITMY